MHGTLIKTREVGSSGPYAMYIINVRVIKTSGDLDFYTGMQLQ